jgi:hypothetical protein
MIYYHADRPLVHFGNADEVQYRPPSTHNILITQELPR